jgi:hypothetical protein
LVNIAEVSEGENFIVGFLRVISDFLDLLREFVDQFLASFVSMLLRGYLVADLATLLVEMRVRPQIGRNQ